MFNYINAIIFGIIQGLTEFLPVSSSGHLVILHKFIPLPINNEIAFDVALHAATLLAVVLFLKSDVWLLLKGWFLSFIGRGGDYGKMAWFLFFATIPAALAGFFFEDFISLILRSSFVVIFMLVFIGILFIIVEKYSVKKINISDLGWRGFLMTGIAQALALIPGTSRSGITIIAGMSLGLKRAEAIKLSFLLAVPIIMGASISKVPVFLNHSFAGEEALMLILAFLSSFISGIFTVKYFLIMANKFSLNFFAYYRFVLAGIISFMAIINII